MSSTIKRNLSLAAVLAITFGVPAVSAAVLYFSAASRQSSAAAAAASSGAGACKAALAQRVSGESTGFQINNAVTEKDGTIRVYYQTSVEYMGRTLTTERHLAECKNGALALMDETAAEPIDREAEAIRESLAQAEAEADHILACDASVGRVDPKAFLDCVAGN